MRRMFRRLLVGALLAFGGLALPGTALAAPILSFTNLTGQNLGNPPFTLGFEFTTDAALLATDIGLFDSGFDGLVESHEIGLWDSGGTLLTSTTVPAGVGATLLDGFRYVSIAPVLLTAGGSYRVGALFTSGADPNIFPGEATGFTTLPGITFDGPRFASGGALTDPTVSGGSEPAYFGPNLQVSSVPEPTALLLITSGVATSLIRRRRRA